jgi:hypothetical protein
MEPNGIHDRFFLRAEFSELGIGQDSRGANIGGSFALMTLEPPRAKKKKTPGK